jgi:hypothetical protein
MRQGCRNAASVMAIIGNIDKGYCWIKRASSTPDICPYTFAQVVNKELTENYLTRPDRTQKSQAS